MNSLVNKLKRKEIYSNWPYIFWLVFYLLLFWFIFGGTSEVFIYLVLIYTVSILFACSSMAESLWRSVSGVRKLMTQSEINRLIPLFEEVYEEAIKKDPNLHKGIKLYIQEDMEINAFAFGKSTLVLTKGSIELLSDENLKGLIAHEFGHFSHFDTIVVLIATVGNMLMSVLMKAIQMIANGLLFIVRNKDVSFSWVIKILHGLVSITHKAIIFIGDLILMSVSREHEYMADEFAYECGYGTELAEVLYEIHQVSISSPGSVIEQLRSTHPPLTNRIQRLEQLYI